MKLTAVLLLVACLQVSARGYSQQVTLDFRNTSLDKVFKSITRQTGYLFVYDLQLLQTAKKVDLQVKDVSIEEVLRLCFKDQPFTYSIVERTVVIKPRAVSAENGAELPAGDIHGKITDSKGKALQGVSVLNKRTRRGGSTDAEGAFVIRGSAGDVLEFTFVGYRSMTYKVTDIQSAVALTMQVEVSSLNEMVVVGYGSSLRKDLTGSVATVDTKDVEDIPFATLDNALAGKVAGVEVTKTDGTPGGAVRIRVRGSTSLLGGNDPLYVIDGVPLQVQNTQQNTQQQTNSALTGTLQGGYVNPGYDVGSPAGNDVNAANAGIGAGMTSGFANGLNSIGGLNIDDIESITILKDASSTAIYGSKAANGVVLITTKRGKKDMKTQVTGSYYSTYTRPVNAKVLDATQYRSLITEAAQNDADYRNGAGIPLSTNDNGILNSPSTFFGTANTDWLKLVTRDTYGHNAQVAVQGGSAASRYYTSVSYNTTPGVMLGSTYQRVAGVLNMENDIGHFRWFTNLDMGYANQNITNGAYGQALRARPDYAPYDATGNFTNFANVGYSYQGFQNPLALTTATNLAKTFSLLGSLSAEYDFTPALRFKSTVSLNMQNYNQDLYTPSYIAISNFYGNTSNSGGIGNNAYRRMNNWFVENTLTWDKRFNEKHALNLLAGTSYETDKQTFFSATGAGYPNDNVLNNLSSAIVPLNVNGDNPSQPQSYLLSYYLRANYSYREKYLLTFTGRTDGSSKFGPDNKYAYFPSGAVGWRLSGENFMKDISWIEDLKLRASYGLTGTQNIGDQMYRTLYSPWGYAGSNALIPSQLGNPAIKWETTKETDAGLDFSFFKGRLQGTLDYYNKRSEGVLLSLPVAPSSSYTSLLTNVATIGNRGFEVSVKGDLIRTKGFKWTTSVNITWNRSIVNKIENADLTQIANLSGVEDGNTAIVAGKPLGLVLGYNVTGIIRTQKQLDAYKSALSPLWSQYLLPYLNLGDPIMALDSTGSPEQQVIASCAPSYYGGFTQEFSYKNFDLTFYFTFSEGGKLVWADDVSSLEFSGTSNANVVMEKRYTASNPNAADPRLVLGDAFLPVSNLNVFNSSYIKLRTISFDYRFDRSAAWMQKARIQNATIFASATNLFTITKYPGNDPETSDDPYSVQGGYYDISNYPPVRSFSLGLKVGF
ncbi:MAG TPA: SusC/RagA family TonB-linked outer membrane protein [Puia sp.]|nr:SusC/RagA family TonB-linked outer membrane protein [Puia sp.]